MKTKTNNADVLADSELDIVVGGQTAYLGMNCSVNQAAAVQGVVDGLGKVPIVGGLLAAGVTVAGSIFCS